MSSDQIITMIVTAIVTGGFSTVTTVTALKVHINYLRESINRHEQAITRAHNRIDHIDKNVFKSGTPNLAK